MYWHRAPLTVVLQCKTGIRKAGAFQVAYISTLAALVGSCLVPRINNICCRHNADNVIAGIGSYSSSREMVSANYSLITRGV